jgi:hypothetical protein
VGPEMSRMRGESWHRYLHTSGLACREKRQGWAKLPPLWFDPVSTEYLIENQRSSTAAEPLHLTGDAHSIVDLELCPAAARCTKQPAVRSFVALREWRRGGGKDPGLCGPAFAGCAFVRGGDA